MMASPQIEWKHCEDGTIDDGLCALGKGNMRRIDMDIERIVEMINHFDKRDFSYFVDAFKVNMDTRATIEAIWLNTFAKVVTMIL